MLVDMENTPRAAGLIAPARTEPHDRTLVAWPTGRPVWGAHRDRAVEEYGALVETVARFERVTVVADPAYAEEARAHCAVDGVDVLELPIDDSWIRDSGPIYLVDRRGAVALVQFRFNAWGEKYSPYDLDADLPRRLAIAHGVRRYTSPLVMEGGGFAVDGEGTLITTESVVRNANRNPGWTREQCEDALRAATGAEKILWLAHGLVEDHDTDGHSDNVVQFAGPARVIVQVAPDRRNPNWRPLRENVERLSGLPMLGADGWRSSRSRSCPTPRRSTASATRCRMSTSIRSTARSSLRGCKRPVRRRPTQRWRPRSPTARSSACPA